jgi:hypothetical protein
MSWKIKQLQTNYNSVYKKFNLYTIVVAMRVMRVAWPASAEPAAAAITKSASTEPATAESASTEPAATAEPAASEPMRLTRVSQRFRKNRGLTAAQHPLAACAAIIEHVFFFLPILTAFAHS